MMGAPQFMMRFLWLPAIVLLVGLAQCTFWALDRKAPFSIVAVSPASGRPGSTILLDVAVKRDISRPCSARFTRQIYDSRGVRYDMEGDQLATSAAVSRSEKMSPGRLLLAIDVPPSAQPGGAVMLTSLAYTCNPVQVLWPIEVTTAIPFEVLPP